MDQSTERELTAKRNSFTSFCEVPDDVEKGFRLVPAFYRRNYRKLLPPDKHASILVISSGPGDFQRYLKDLNGTNVLGIDSDPEKAELANGRGLQLETDSCFDFLPRDSEYNFMFGEQEVNHLTRDEFLEFLELLGRCRVSLRPNRGLLLVAANRTNPLIAAEDPGNNRDHYSYTAEDNLKQAFAFAGSTKATPILLDYYVLWKNPTNYVTKLITDTFHLLLRVIFRIYGKNASIFTKRLAILGLT